ncbi:MAG: lipocalin-like domain-containing protein [Gammaproteobacteria bacterium]|nr:lipocalin-like domain-containing protein [Gammaproteobacteria bacterium]
MSHDTMNFMDYRHFNPKGVHMTYRLSSILVLFLIWSLAIAADVETVGATTVIGSWDLVSLENLGADGSVQQPFGEHPVGRLTYTADGLMSAQIMHGERAKFKTAELYSGTPEEKIAAYNSYIAYYGSFAIDTAAHTLTHHVTASLFPNWLGGDQVRFYELAGDTLTLTSKAFPAHGTQVTPHVVWQRVRADNR